MSVLTNIFLAQASDVETALEAGWWSGFFASALGRWTITLVVFGLLGWGIRHRKNVLGKLFRLQRGKWFRIGVSAAVVVGSALYFGILFYKAGSLQTQRTALFIQLAGQNQADYVPTLESRGEVRITIDGRQYVYGGDHIKRGLNLYLTKQTAEPGQFREIAEPGVLIEDLLRDRRPTWAPDFLSEQPGTTTTVGVLFVVWLLLIIWIELFVAFVLTITSVAVLWMLCMFAGWDQGLWVIPGIGLLTFTFVLLSRAFMLLYQSNHQVLAVAYTLLKEAGRQRTSLVFIVLLLVLLPLLPTWLDPDDPLRFRIQSFISTSLRLTFGLAACMTLVLSCATVAFEIRDRQIWQLATKPLNRFNYLLGKWLGLCTLNVILLIVSGVSIMMYVQYLRNQPVEPGLEGRVDRMLVRDEVLTARNNTRPTYEQLTPEQLEERYVQSMRNRDLDPVTADYETELNEKRRLQERHLAMQRSIPPLGALHTYVFDNLQDARRHRSNMMLRFRYHMLDESDHEAYPVEFIIHAPDRTITVAKKFRPTLSHTLPIPRQFISDEGQLQITVRNMYVPTIQEQTLQRGALSWEVKDFELLHKVGTFEPNFIRAMTMQWVKLAFLGMLGVACATFLSFPVACLLSFTVFIAALLSPFLNLSLGNFNPPPTEHMDWGNLGLVIEWAAMNVIKGIAVSVVWMLQAFGEFNPTRSLVEGRYISWGAVGITLLKIGIGWTGLVTLVGGLVFRKRELATYSGHG